MKKLPLLTSYTATRWLVEILGQAAVAALAVPVVVAVATSEVVEEASCC